MECAPLCPTTCSNYGLASPCPAVCIRGCGCPQGMVVDEDLRRCVMPSQCPNKSRLHHTTKKTFAQGNNIYCDSLLLSTAVFLYMPNTPKQ